MSGCGRHFQGFLLPATKTPGYIAMLWCVTASPGWRDSYPLLPNTRPSDHGLALSQNTNANPTLQPPKLQCAHTTVRVGPAGMTALYPPPRFTSTSPGTARVHFCSALGTNTVHGSCTLPKEILLVFFFWLHRHMGPRAKQRSKNHLMMGFNHTGPRKGACWATG